MTDIKLQSINIGSGSLRPTTPDNLLILSDPWLKNMRAQSDWSVRLAREFEYTSSKGGCVVFVTFTFDDDHLVPCVFHTSLNHINFPNVKMFDNEGISEDVVRPLRQNYGYVFKYVVFPEYGKDKDYIDFRGVLRHSTRRPHYHCVFFFDSDIDILVLHTRLLTLWGRCIDKCLDVVKITDNYGFTNYVSKYVAKGIDKEMMPKPLLNIVGMCRTWKRVLRSKLYNQMTPQEQTQIERACELLHWYDTHRPKLLCSNGIGSSIPYTDEELERGTVIMYNGHKNIEVPIPSYNIRNYMYDKGTHSVPLRWNVNNGSFHPFMEVVMQKANDWSLNDKGRKLRRLIFEKSLYKEIDENERLLASRGHISDVERDILSRIDFDFVCTSATYDDLCANLRKEIESVFGGFYPMHRALHAFRHVFRGMSVGRFSDLFGIEFDYNITHEKMVSMSDVLFDELNELSSEYGIYPSSTTGVHNLLFENVTEIGNILWRLDVAFKLIKHAQNTCDYLRRKKLRDLERLAKGLFYPH